VNLKKIRLLDRGIWLWFLVLLAAIGIFLAVYFSEVEFVGRIIGYVVAGATLGVFLFGFISHIVNCFEIVEGALAYQLHNKGVSKEGYVIRSAGLSMKEKGLVAAWANVCVANNGFLEMKRRLWTYHPEIYRKIPVLEIIVKPVGYVTDLNGNRCRGFQYEKDISIEFGDVLYMGSLFLHEVGHGMLSLTGFEQNTGVQHSVIRGAFGV